MNQPTEESWQELADAAMTRLLAWDLTQRDKLVAGWLVELSYRRGRESVCVPVQGLFAKLTGLDEAHVSRSLAGLQRAGLLQVMGPRNGPKWYRLLPNGRLLEPETLADPNQVRFALAEIERANAPGPGCEPGGQRRMTIVTNEEQLAVEQAAASRVMAREAARFLREPDLAERARSPEVILPNKQDRLGPGGGSGTYAGARNVKRYPHRTTNVPTLNVGDVGSLPGGNGAAVADGVYALELVRKVVPPAEFDPWERKWEQRVGLRGTKDQALRPQPLLVAEAAGEVARDIRQGIPVPNPGGSIVDRVRRWLGKHADTFRML